MTHPEDVRPVYLSDCRGADYDRLDDALSASDRGLDVELLRPSEHDGIVLLGAEVALGHLYAMLQQHTEKFEYEGVTGESDALERLCRQLYDGLPNARAAVGLARIQQERRRGGDKPAVEETYAEYDYEQVNQ